MPIFLRSLAFPKTTDIVNALGVITTFNGILLIPQGLNENIVNNTKLGLTFASPPSVWNSYHVLILMVIKILIYFGWFRNLDLSILMEHYFITNEVNGSWRGMSIKTGCTLNIMKTSATLGFFE